MVRTAMLNTSEHDGVRVIVLGHDKVNVRPPRNYPPGALVALADRAGHGAKGPVGQPIESKRRGGAATRRSPTGRSCTAVIVSVAPGTRT